MFWLSVILGVLIASLQTAEGSTPYKVSCDQGPVNGAVSVSEDRLHTFSCVNSSFVLVGPRTARCSGDDLLDIKTLPACALKVGRTTSVRSRYSNVPCTQHEIERRKAAIQEYLQTSDCLAVGTCTFREAKHTCLDTNKLLIELLYLTADDTARESIAKMVASMTRSGRRTKRQFDDLTPDNSDTSDCASGHVVIEDNCIACTPGTYAQEPGEPCTECGIGTYQPSSASSYCLSCDDVTAGSSTIYTASDDAGDCVVTCQLPTTVVNALFTVENVQQSPGTNVAAGTSVTLLCSEGYSYSSGPDTVITCENSETVFPNECYKVTVHPDEPIYKLRDDLASATVTCSVASSTDIVGFNVELKEGSTLVAYNIEASGEKTYTAGVATQAYKITLHDVQKGGVGEATCKAEVKEGFFETTSDKIRIVFFDIVIDPTAVTADVGASTALSVRVTYDTLSAVHFTWNKDKEAYLLIGANEVVEIDNIQYVTSVADFAAISFDDAGYYEVSVAISDLVGTEHLSTTLGSQVKVRGFTVHPTESAVLPNKGDEVRLTCAFQELKTGEHIGWIDNNGQIFDKEHTTSTLSDTTKTETSVLTFSNWPGDVEGTYVFCAIVTGDSVVQNIESNKTTIHSFEYTITVGEEKSVLWGDDEELSCTASSPDILAHPPTVTWYKKVPGGEDLYLADGEDYVTNSAKETNELVSVLTIKAAVKADAGEYYCVAQYTEPYIKITSDESIHFTVVDFECNVTNQTIANGNVISKSLEGKNLTFRFECNPGYWFAEGSGDLLYCDLDTGNPVYPICEKLNLEANIVEHKEGVYLLEISYTSETKTGTGILCDDGWDNSEAELICKHHGFKYGRAVSLETYRNDFALTRLSCPHNNDISLQYCSATRYQDSDLPCLSDETAGLFCYNKLFEYRSSLLKSGSNSNVYKISLQVSAYKHGTTVDLKSDLFKLKKSSFSITSGSANLEISKSKVRVKRGKAVVKLTAKKLENLEAPQLDCVNVTIAGPVLHYNHETEPICFD